MTDQQTKRYTPTTRKKAFVQKTIKENQSKQEPLAFRELCNSLENTPLDVFMSRLSGQVDPENIEYENGQLKHTMGIGPDTSNIDEDGITEFDALHWLSWDKHTTDALGLASKGLLFATVHNKYRSDRIDNEEGDHHTIIDGELLLTASGYPEHSIVFTAKGDTYLDVGSVGQVYNVLSEPVMMSLNGQPFWADFDLYGWETKENYRYYNQEETERGVETDEERVAVLQKLIASTFPDQTITADKASAILEAVSRYFAPLPRPYRIGDY